MLKKNWLVFPVLIAVGVGSLLIHNKVYANQEAKPSWGKNLQVLTFVKTKKELKGWMDMFKQSLGVNCAFCHNTNNFASDAKPQKRIARVMLKMLLQLRSTYFSFPHAKKPTCYTCHQGHERPMNMPPGGFKHPSPIE